MEYAASNLTTEVCVKRKVKDGWFVYTCDQLPGLYIAHQDDLVAYNDVPASIAMLMRLDYGYHCTVAHKLSYSDFVRQTAVDKIGSPVESPNQDVLEGHDGIYYQYILQRNAKDSWSCR